VEMFTRLFQDRFHRRLTRLAHLFASLLAKLQPGPGDFALNKMCPFCGLITPRSKTFCLECRKSFREA
jgi:hypothetical protein